MRLLKYCVGFRELNAPREANKWNVNYCKKCRCNLTVNSSTKVACMLFAHQSHLRSHY